MLFEKQFEEYKGEDLSELIGDEWKEECDCEEVCKECNCGEK
jgi:hypothetical protein